MTQTEKRGRLSQRERILRLAQMGVLTAISIVLVAFVRIPLVPAAPFLMYDMADAPILLVTLLFGLGPGWMVLAVVSVIQALFFDPNGWVGCLMHLVASGALISTTWCFFRWKKSLRWCIAGMAVGTLAMAALMVPMNYIFTVHVFGEPKELVDAIMLPGIVPFNLIKAGGNSAIAMVLFKTLEKLSRHTSLGKILPFRT